MKFFPYENYNIKSKLSPEIIMERLSERTEPEKRYKFSFLAPKFEKQYMGTIEGMNFSIHRNIFIRNSFLPRISGEVVKGPNITNIFIKMGLHPFAIAFMLIWMSGITFMFITILFKNAISRWLAIIPFVFLLFGYLLPTSGFKYESLKSKNFLADLFEAE